MLGRAEEEDEFSFRGEETYFTNPKILQKPCVIVSQGNRVTRANFDEEEEEEEGRRTGSSELSSYRSTIKLFEKFCGKVLLVRGNDALGPRLTAGRHN